MNNEMAIQVSADEAKMFQPIGRNNASDMVVDADEVIEWFTDNNDSCASWGGWRH